LQGKSSGASVQAPLLLGGLRRTTKRQRKRVDGRNRYFQEIFQMSMAPAVSASAAGTLWTFADVEFDEPRWALRVAGRPVELEPKPLKILSLLLNNAGQVVTREELLALLWPGTHVVDKAVTNAVAKLRQALGPAGAHSIRTVPKVGYLWAAEVRQQDSPATLPVVAAPVDEVVAAATATVAAMTSPAPAARGRTVTLARYAPAGLLALVSLLLLLALGLMLGHVQRQRQAALAERQATQALIDALADGPRDRLQALQAAVQHARSQADAAAQLPGLPSPR